MVERHGLRAIYHELRKLDAEFASESEQALVLSAESKPIGDMVTYEITATGPVGNQVIAISPE